MTTLRQIQANQANSLHSTGPKDPRGKERSRQNAVKHGLAGTGIVVPEDVRPPIEERKSAWRADFRPVGPREEWLFEQLVTASVQMDCCVHEEQALRTRLAARASTCWDDDRRLDAEVLAGGLSRRPSLVSRQLRLTTQGCDWLRERWEGLGLLLETKGEWSEAQTALALDLLGVPPELRGGPTRLDPIGAEDDVRAHRAALVADEVARLREAQETYLVALDARDRAAAELGLHADIPAPLARLRRYASSCERRFRWALGQLGRGLVGNARPESGAAPGPPTAPVPTPAPSPTIDPAEEWDALMRELNGIPDAVADDPGPSSPAGFPALSERAARLIDALAATAMSAPADPPRPARRA